MIKCVRIILYMDMPCGCIEHRAVHGAPKRMAARRARSSRTVYWTMRDYAAQGPFREGLAGGGRVGGPLRGVSVLAANPDQ